MRGFLRQFVILAVSRLRLSRLLFRLHRSLRGRGLLCVFPYHRVVDGSLTREYYTDYDRGTDAAMFERHLEAIQKYFRLVGLDEFISLLKGNTRLDSHAAMLTFDDADSEFISTTLPILQRHGASGLVAAPVAFIGTEHRLWHVRVSNLFRYMTDDQWAEIQSHFERWPAAVAEVVRASSLPPVSQRRKLCRAINRALDSVNHSTVDKLVDQWECIVSPPDQLPIRCTDWKGLRELEKAGISVESHGLTHRKLTTLDDNEIRREMTESKRVLEDFLNKTVRAVAYPQGYCDERVLRSASEAGYEIGLTTQRTPCNVPSEGQQLFRVPRVDVFGETLDELNYYFAKICLKSLFRRKPW